MVSRHSGSVMIRCAPKVWLSQEARDDLERFARSRTLAARLVERARIILRAAAGQENQQIAGELGLCRQTVGRWRERFAVAQMDGLEDRPRSGRPARILSPTMEEGALWNHDARLQASRDYDPVCRHEHSRRQHHQHVHANPQSSGLDSLLKADTEADPPG